MRKTVSTLVLLACAVSLSACGVKKDASYESVQDLRSAVIDSDGDCPGETADGEGEGGEVLIRCSDDLTLRWFPNEDELKWGKVAVSLGALGDQSMLAGPNWIIQSETDELADIQESLGGELTVS